MITTRLHGRLGNQMFQIANCIAYGLRHNMEYAIPQVTGNTDLWPVYFSHYPKLNQGFENFAPYREPGHGYMEIPKKEQICFEGYWQSYRYFADYNKEILRSFEPGFAVIDDKGFSYKDRVSIHVRRGDYTELDTKHPPVSLDYIKQAIKQMLELGYSRFTVYSDDPKWCKENITPELNWDAYISVFDEVSKDPIKDALFDLWTMSKHEHNIIANSTFSWWAAMLNKNPEKIVISPSKKNWFGEDYKHLNLDHFLLPQWIQIEY